MNKASEAKLLILQRFSGTEVQELASEVLRLKGLLRDVVAHGPPESGDSEGHLSQYRCCYRTVEYEEHAADCWWVRVRDSIEPSAGATVPTSRPCPVCMGMSYENERGCSGCDGRGEVP